MPSFSPRALAYFRCRAIDPAVAFACGVRERGGCIVFPARDADGKPSERFRRLAEGSGPKTRGRAGRTLGVWWPAGTPTAGVRVDQDVLVCEGESDALAAVTALGPQDRVLIASLPGASFPTRVLIAEMRRVGAKVAALAFDGDCAGGMNSDRLAWALVEQGVGARILAVPFGEDLASTLAGCGERGRAWLGEALIRARPVGLVEAALVAENRWLRARLLLGLGTVDPCNGVGNVVR